MKKRIVYTPHLLFRMKIRDIPTNLPKQIYRMSQEKYIDSHTGNHIAVKEIKHKRKRREMIIVYRETDEEVKIITIHPLKSYQRQARIISGRWRKHE